MAREHADLEEIVRTLWQRNPKLFRRLRKVSHKTGKTMLEIAHEAEEFMINQQAVDPIAMQHRRETWQVFPCGQDPTLR